MTLCKSMGLKILKTLNCNPLSVSTITDRFVTFLSRVLTTEELIQQVDELELRIERLRVLYEQYFVGIEKTIPYVLQKEVDRRVWVLRREKIRSTIVRFRFQQLLQRLNSFTSYWQRICREIENGTHKRVRLRVQRFESPKQDIVSHLSQRTTGIDNHHMSNLPDYHSLYNRYITLRQNNGESVHGLTYEVFAHNLQSARERIRIQYEGREVEFQVANKDGKTVLKPVFM